jgi:hypothetical protein
MKRNSRVFFKGQVHPRNILYKIKFLSNEIFNITFRENVIVSYFRPPWGILGCSPRERLNLGTFYIK